MSHAIAFTLCNNEIKYCNTWGNFCKNKQDMINEIQENKTSYTIDFFKCIFYSLYDVSNFKIQNKYRESFFKKNDNTNNIMKMTNNVMKMTNDNSKFFTNLKDMNKKDLNLNQTILNK